MEFLRAAKSASGNGRAAGAGSPDIGAISGAVAVIGGGSVALDAARTAVRLGADPVSVICLERLEPGLKDSMLALTAEIEDERGRGGPDPSLARSRVVRGEGWTGNRRADAWSA